MVKASSQIKSLVAFATSIFIAVQPSLSLAASEINTEVIRLKEKSAKTTAPSGYKNIYANTDGKLYVVDSVGQEARIGSSDGGVGTLFGRVVYTATAGCAWSTTSPTFANYTADSDCPTPTAYGKASVPGTKIPGLNFAILPKGEYLIVSNGGFRNSNASTVDFAYRFSTGSLTTGGARSTGSQFIGSGTVAQHLSVSDTQTNVTLQAQGYVGSGGSADIMADSTNFEIAVYRFSTEEEIYRPDEILDLRGSLIFSRKATCPQGSVLANGGTTPSEIVDIFGATLPDWRGLFVRGAGTNGTMTTANGTAFSATLGSTQNDQMQGHQHRPTTNSTNQSMDMVSTATPNLYTIGFGSAASINNAPNTGNPVTDGTNGSPRVGVESRPANVALNPCIVYAKASAPLIRNSVVAQYSDVTKINVTKTVTVAPTLGPLDETVILNTSSGAITQALPAASLYPGKKYIFAMTSSSNYAVLDPNGSETICGRSTIQLQGANDSVTVQSDGSNWKVIAGGCQKTEFGKVDYACTTGSCTVTDSSEGISSVTWTGTGGYRITFAWTASNNWTCTANSRYTNGHDMWAQYGTTSTTIAEWSMVYAGTAQNAPFVFSCNAKR